MVIINIPSKDLYLAILNELENKYGIVLKRRIFYGFRVDTGRYPVTVVTPANVRSVAWRIARDRDSEVVEIFRNNSCHWELEKKEKK